MQELRVVFRERTKRTPSVESFRFWPAQRLSFLPGQFLQVIFDEQDRENKDLNKYLSFSCSPHREYIEVTKRLSASSFSQRLNSLQAGDEVLIKAPLGSCVFEAEYKKIAFLIGGIGITPVISILQHIAEEAVGTDACLVYSNRSEDETAFKEELDSLCAGSRDIKVYYVLTDCRPKQAGAIFGRIDKGLLERYLPGLRERIVFIFGPPKMTEAMSSLAIEMGCSEEGIKTEKFIGY
jgi:ferredoxin-NADP reductase